jgi:hypothetical protein
MDSISTSSESAAAASTTASTVVDSSPVIAEPAVSAAKDVDVEEGNGEAETDGDEVEEVQPEPDNNIDMTEVRINARWRYLSLQQLTFSIFSFLFRSLNRKARRQRSLIQRLTYDLSMVNTCQRVDTFLRLRTFFHRFFAHLALGMASSQLSVRQSTMSMGTRS